MNEKPSVAKIALKWGLITGLVEILVTTIRYALGYYSGLTSTLFTVAVLVIVVIGLVLALREFREGNGGYISIGEMVNLGALMFAVMGLLDTAFTQIYQTYIDPDLLAKTMQQMRDFMEKQGVPDDQLDKMDEKMSETIEQQRQKGFSGSSFLLSILWWVFGGVMFSLIASIFMRRKKENPFD